jgi:hypothetical protein
MITIFLNQAVFLKDILPKGSRAVCARTNIQGNSPVAGIFFPVFDPAYEIGIIRPDLKPAYRATANSQPSSGPLLQWISRPTGRTRALFQMGPAFAASD